MHTISSIFKPINSGTASHKRLGKKISQLQLPFIKARLLIAHLVIIKTLSLPEQKSWCLKTYLASKVHLGIKAIQAIKWGVTGGN